MPQTGQELCLDILSIFYEFSEPAFVTTCCAARVPHKHGWALDQPVRFRHDRLALRAERLHIRLPQLSFRLLLQGVHSRLLVPSGSVPIAHLSRDAPPSSLDL